MLNEETVKKFKASLRGVLIQTNDEGYDNARKVYNAMIDRRPRLIARCADVADVITAVNFVRENDMLVAIRGGGHNAGGLGLCDDGLVIDLSPIKYTRIDPVARTARVGGGCTWGEVDHATHAFGLATSSGVISTTGVGGLTLGGGLGHLTRRFGLTIDNLLSADMVLADGRFVTVSAEENEDLFWAIRGGGGNFGVVTSFLFRLHPVGTVYAGPMLWGVEQVTEVMQWYREFISQASEDINGFFAFLVVPPGPPFPQHLHKKTMCGVIWCYTGPLDQAELSDDAITLHRKYGSDLPTMHSAMHLYPINGAAHRVGKNDTPWAYRDATWAQVIVGVDPDPANNARIISWAREYWEALHPFSAGGAYVNFMMEEGEDRVRATYRDNYERLVTIKNKYDPSNLFSVNQNIKPTT
jgi:FAD/FMN-containing dehydrogenase